MWGGKKGKGVEKKTYCSVKTILKRKGKKNWRKQYFNCFLFTFSVSVKVQHALAF